MCELCKYILLFPAYNRTLSPTKAEYLEAFLS
jgi:hypothetical protein